MLTKKTTEAAYAQFLSETNYKRLPKTADALFTQLEKQLRTIDETENDGFFPAIAAALFRMVKAVNRNRELLSEFYWLLTVLADIYKSVAEPTHSGILDEPTADSLSSFQILCGLPMTGTLDKHTWKHLALHYPLATNLNNLP